MHACLEGALSFLAAPSWQLTPPANLDATASPGLPLIGTRTPRLQNSRRSCARTILQESARKCAHSCILWSAIRQTTKSKKVPFLSIHRCHTHTHTHTPPSLTQLGTISGGPYSASATYVDTCKIGGGFFKVIHASTRDLLLGLNRFFSAYRSHIEQRRAHGIRKNVTAILLYPLSAGAFHCIGKLLTALTRYYKVRC